MPTAPEIKRAAPRPSTAFAVEASRPFPSTPTTDSTCTSTLTWAPCIAACTTVWPTATSTPPTSTRPLAPATSFRVQGDWVIIQYFPSCQGGARGEAEDRSVYAHGRRKGLNTALLESRGNERCLAVAVRPPVKFCRTLGDMR